MYSWICTLNIIERKSPVQDAIYGLQRKFSLQEQDMMALVKIIHYGIYSDAKESGNYYYLVCKSGESRMSMNYFHTLPDENITYDW